MPRTSREVPSGTFDAGRKANHGPNPTDHDSFPIGFGDILGDEGGDDDGDDDRPAGGADGHGLGFRASSGDSGDPGVDLSPWAPLLGMLESTESEASPDDGPFTPGEGVEQAHALELRAESMLQYGARGAVRTGALDRTEVGTSDDNRDVVAGRDQVEVDGMLQEHTGQGLVHVADEVEMNVGGPLTKHAHLEDNIIMAGVMRDEFAGGTFITAAMSDDMAAGVGLRCTAPLDVWVHGLAAMEERPGTCAADGLLLELAGTLYEREYGPSAHVAAVARLQGTVATTMRTGFRPLMKVALGVRNLIPGGGGGGAGADASPPAAAPGGGEATGAATGTATLGAVESGGSVGRGAAGADDTDEIVSVVRTVESASDTADVEALQHPASTADNLDDLARVDVEGEGYRQVGEIYGEPVPAGGWVETEDGELYPIVSRDESLQDPSDLGGAGAHPLADADTAPPLAPEQPGAEPSPGAGSAASGPERRQPPPLDMTEPGAEGYDFRNAYGSVHDRNQFSTVRRMNLRGNFFTREYLSEIDARAVELFTDLGGNTDDIVIDNFGLRTSSAYDNLEQMAREADEAGNVSRAAECRAAMAEIEEMTNGSIIELAARTDEFSGAAIGSQRAPIDANIDVEKLRGWLKEQELQAQAKFMECMAADDSEAAELAGWERGYYDQMVRLLDENVNPLAYSNEQIVFVRNNKVDPYYAQFADEVAAAAAEGYDLVIPRPKAENELDLYIELQQLLVATLSDPEFFRSAEDMGVDAYPVAVRARIEAGLDFLGPDSLRPLAGGDIPPPLPAAGPRRQCRLRRRGPRSELLAKRARRERGGARAPGGQSRRRRRLGSKRHAGRGLRLRRALARQPPSPCRQRPGSRHRRAVRPVDRRSAGGNHRLCGASARRLPARARRRRPLAVTRCLVGVGASGVGRPRGRRRRRQPGRCRHFGPVQGGVRARGCGSAGLRTGAARLGRERRQPLRLAGRALRRHRARGREPHRHRRGAGRARPLRARQRERAGRARPLRARQRERAGRFRHPFAHHRGHARSGAHRLHPGRGGHRCHAFRRLGARCARERRRHACGPLR